MARLCLVRGRLWTKFAEAEDMVFTSLFLKATFPEPWLIPRFQNPIPAPSPGAKAPKAKRFRIPRVLEITIPPLYIVMSHNPLYTWEADSGGCTQ